MGAIDAKPGAMETVTRSRITPLDWVSIILVAIGAINWGLVGLFEFDLVAAIFGQLSALSRIVYVLVAIAGVYLLVIASTRVGGRSTLGGRPDLPIGTG
jgi:uncharacterized membrane protein YuzA (DUF378 family)